LPSKIEFKVNKYITLKLEEGKTNIYLQGELFRQCKYLILNISVDNISSFDEIESIDEAIEKYENSIRETNENKINIPAEVEFWGHCSNLQVWAENNYNTRLLHSNLAFPLLKELSKIGDPSATKILKEQVIKRLLYGYPGVVYYLINEGYLNNLKKDELTTLSENIEDLIRKLLYNFLKSKKTNGFLMIKIFKFLKKIVPHFYDSIIQTISKDKNLLNRIAEVFNSNFQKSYKDYYVVEDLQNFLINIIKTFHDLKVTNTLFFYIELYAHYPIVKDFKFLYGKFPCSDELAEVLFQCIDRSIKNQEFQTDYFPLIYPKLYQKLVKNRLEKHYDINNSESVKEVVEFFELLWILLTLIPNRVEMWIENHIGKYGGDYEEYWDDCYEFVQEHEVMLKIEKKNNYVFFENLWLGDIQELISDWFGVHATKIKLKQHLNH